jgi:hypothetical protein
MIITALVVIAASGLRAPSRLETLTLPVGFRGYMFLVNRPARKAAAAERGHFVVRSKAIGRRHGERFIWVNDLGSFTAPTYKVYVGKTAIPWYYIRNSANPRISLRYFTGPVMVGPSRIDGSELTSVSFLFVGAPAEYNRTKNRALKWSW